MTLPFEGVGKAYMHGHTTNKTKQNKTKQNKTRVSSSFNTCVSSTTRTCNRVTLIYQWSTALAYHKQQKQVRDRIQQKWFCYKEQTGPSVQYLAV